jgi:hypothetical protein
MSQIALVSDQHNHNVGICVVAQLLKPPSYIIVGLVFTDIVDKQSANCATIVC